MDYHQGFLYSFVAAAICVGLGFIAHELSHKYLAQRYGAWAEFRANDVFLFVAVAMSFLGFVFAAPGAVVIKGTVTRKQLAKIDAAGICANIVIALLFFALYMGFSNPFLRYGMVINGWLALFNLIPIAPFDGAGLFRNNKALFFVLAGLAFGLQLLGMIVP